MNARLELPSPNRRVYLNQLKKVDVRAEKYKQTHSQVISDYVAEKIDPTIFDFEISDHYGNFRQDCYHEPNHFPCFAIDNSYVDLDETNILPNRLRDRHQ